jgi:hypothetical protein
LPDAASEARHIAKFSLLHGSAFAGFHHVLCGAYMLFFSARSLYLRYRLELILSFPLVALVMARYLAFIQRGQRKVEGRPGLMVAVVCCTAVMIFLLFVDVPMLHQIFRADCRFTQ